jgi:hypothetical protein
MRFGARISAARKSVPVLPSRGSSACITNEFMTLFTGARGSAKGRSKSLP